MDSTINRERHCIVCGTTINLHRHHVFGAGNRKYADQDGLWVYLCARHHNMSDEGVHFNKELDTGLKQLAQATYERTHTRQEFMERYGRNYL